jgi:hypothetical protein
VRLGAVWGTTERGFEIWREKKEMETIRIFQVDFSAGCGEVLEIITQYFYTA